MGRIIHGSKPPRDCRRHFGLSHAAMADCSIMARSSQELMSPAIPEQFSSPTDIHSIWLKTGGLISRMSFLSSAVAKSE